MRRAILLGVTLAALASPVSAQAPLDTIPVATTTTKVLAARINVVIRRVNLLQARLDSMRAPAPAPVPPVDTVKPPPADTVPLGNGEPVYDAAKHKLILRDSFDQYASTGAALNAYPVNRGGQYVALTPGRGGSGNAVRLRYGVGAADDIIFGPETRLERVGGWNGTLPQKAGPYTHFYFTTWFRLSAGANPAQNNSSGIKGFMFWTGSGRYQNAVNQLSADGATRGPKGANPNNAESGFNLYKTADGRAPLWSTYADGAWHRFTIEIYAGGDPSGHWGERYWVDGALIYSDVDLRVGGGTRADHYDYASPVTHWMVFGNFISASAASSFFTFDVDDWSAWTPN